MKLFGNEPAEPENATAKIAVWWDMMGCPIPEGYDARRVRPSIEAAFKELGYSGPVSITVYGDQKQTPCHLLRGLSSTGVAVAHSKLETTFSLMYKDMLEWRAHNPPPATMMLISDQVQDVFAFDLVRLQQETQYNIFLAYPPVARSISVLYTSAEWLWESLLEPKSALIVEDDKSGSELSAKFYCKTCCFDGQSPPGFRKHLSSKKHAVQEVLNPLYAKLDSVARKWVKNYPAKPEYATAQIAVWWDMIDCPIPEGYDPRLVRPSIEAAFKQLGYSGPVSITAHGDLKQAPDTTCEDSLPLESLLHIPFPISPFEVIYSRMLSDSGTWQDHNPPPATIMFISDNVNQLFSESIARDQQRRKYNLFMGYSCRPYKMSVLVTSAEWLWESLLAVAETRRHVLQKCSGRGESTTEMFYCEVCFCDCKSLDDFTKHLSSEEHAKQEGGVHASIRENNLNRRYSQKVSVLRDFPESKRLRKAYRTGFGHLHNHLRLANR